MASSRQGQRSIPVRFTKDSVYEGQTLFLSGYYTEQPKKVRVIKVGRTIITVDLNGVETKFDMATGYGKRNYHMRIGTFEQYADDLRRIDIQNELKQYGIELMSISRNIPTVKLEKILKVIES